jgi:hypothetical protein
MKEELNNQALKFKNFPEGSLSKKTYDRAYLPFQTYLDKYYKDVNLNSWNYINEKFILPIFDNSDFNIYLTFLKKARPNFLPNQDKALLFAASIKHDDRFKEDFKLFFAFLYSIDFYRDLSFEEWLNVKYWKHPWFVDNDDITILEILKYQNAENYLRELFANLSIFESF